NRRQREAPDPNASEIGLANDDGNDAGIDGAHQASAHGSTGEGKPQCAAYQRQNGRIEKGNSQLPEKQLSFSLALILAIRIKWKCCRTKEQQHRDEMEKARSDQPRSKHHGLYSNWNVPFTRTPSLPTACHSTM